jgi:hypothetical protein
VFQCFDDSQYFLHLLISIEQNVPTSAQGSNRRAVRHWNKTGWKAIREQYYNKVKKLERNCGEMDCSRRRRVLLQYFHNLCR